MDNDDELNDLDQQLNGSKAELATELEEANANFTEATSALGIVVKQLQNTRQLLGRYTNYFRIAVAAGVLAVTIAVVGAVAQYNFNQRLEFNQEAIEYETTVREYNDCLQRNDSRANIVGVLALVGEQSQQGTNRTPEEQAQREAALQRFIDLVRERFPQVDCGAPPRRN